MGTGTSKEALVAAIQETDERAQVSIGLLSYMNHLTCPSWALNMTTLQTRQKSKFELTLQLVKLVENHLNGRPVYLYSLPSGSTSEGMCLPTTCTMQGDQIIHCEFADHDDLVIDTCVLVADSPAEARALGTNLVLDTSHTADAFAQVRVLYYSGNITPSLCQTRLHSGRKNVYLSRAIHTQVFGNTSHGPAVTDEILGTVESVETRVGLEGSTDQVYCIPCSRWPDDMHIWASRPRHQGWPSKGTIETVLQMPCYLVPVAHKLSTDPEIEWRISFSAAELIIADTFTITKRQVYILFKYLVKEAISGLGTGMCTYHLKTTFSWANETVLAEYWAPHRMGAAFLAVLDVLETFLQRHHIPNYFFPKSNLIAHLTQDQISVALTAVQRIRNQPLSRLLDTQDRLRLDGQPLLHSFKSLFGPDILGINENILVGRGVDGDTLFACAVTHASAFLSQRAMGSTLHTLDWHRELTQTLFYIDVSESQLWFSMYHLALHRCGDLDLAIEYVDYAIVKCEALVPVTKPDPDDYDWLWVRDTGPHNYDGDVFCAPLSHHRTVHEVISMLKILLGQFYHVKMHQSIGNARQICEVRAKALLEEGKKLYPSVMCDSEFNMFFRRRNIVLSPGAVWGRVEALLKSKLVTAGCERKNSAPNQTSNAIATAHASLPVELNSTNRDILLENATHWMEILLTLTQLADEFSHNAKFSAQWKVFLPLEAHILEAPLSSLVLEIESNSIVRVPYEIYLVYSMGVRIQDIAVHEMQSRIHNMTCALLGIFFDMLTKEYEQMPVTMRKSNAELSLSTVLLMRAILAWHGGLYSDAKEFWMRAHALMPDINTLNMCLQLQDGDDLEEFFQPSETNCNDVEINQITVEDESTCSGQQGIENILDLTSSNNEDILFMATPIEMQNETDVSDAAAVAWASPCGVNSSSNKERPDDSGAKCDSEASFEPGKDVNICPDNTAETHCLDNENNVLYKGPRSPNENSDPPFSSEPCETTPLLQPSDDSLSPTSCPGRDPLEAMYQSASLSTSRRQWSRKSKVCLILGCILLFPLILVLLLCFIILKCLLKVAPYIVRCCYTLETGTERLKGSLFGCYHIIPPDEVQDPEDLEWMTGTFRPRKTEDAIPTVKTINNFAAILQARGINTTGLWPLDRPRFYAALGRVCAEVPVDHVNPVGHLNDVVGPVPQATLELHGTRTTIDCRQKALIKDGQQYHDHKPPNEINLENAINYKNNKKLLEEGLFGSIGITQGRFKNSN